ncbi:uncharacterized protein J8A68_004270 [[Candida] subhashii]|uniref:Uncharacterized protein n=1 Tax=[Candida] subhashii TaxID=561895 RepID=A0A8J5QT69_9ASCO|nr:uncharacterized protein J8A68_004270 [[Candida] subhashii]KAG7662260.1 hypothetical protein J8A68_004270 [[Candida] subhashii]
MLVGGTTTTTMTHDSNDDKGDSDTRRSIYEFKYRMSLLITKLHELNELKLKQPKLFNIKFPSEFIQKIERPKKRVKRNTQGGISMLRRKRKGGNTPPIDAADASDEVEDDFINPSSAEERLISLELILSNEVYEIYEEIFDCLKPTFVSLDIPGGQKIPRLSTVCSFEIGKEMMRTANITYFEGKTTLNSSDSNGELNKVIDDWLQREPRAIMDRYRLHFMAGYLIHLLVFHSQSVLFPSIPVIIQWLREQKSMHLNMLGRTLCDRFWQATNTETDDADVALKVDHVHIKIFWSLYVVGYWDTFLHNRQMMEILQYIVDIRIFEKLERDLGLTKRYFQNQIFSLLERNIDHPNTNPILISIIVRIVQSASTDFKKCVSIGNFYDYLESLYSMLLEFVRNWIAFPIGKKKSIFNAKFADNDRIFYSLIRLCEFSIKHLTNILKKVDDDFGLFSTLFKKFGALKDTIEVLEAFYLQSDQPIEITSPETISKTIMDIQNTLYNIRTNARLDAFLVWLTEKNQDELAQKLSNDYYS